MLIAISRSGNNQEVINLLEKCKQFGMTAISITGSRDSQLALSSDIVLYCPVTKEACPLNLTPTSSATVAATALAQMRRSASRCTCRPVVGHVRKSLAAAATGPLAAVVSLTGHLPSWRV